MFGRRNPDQPNETPSPASPSSESDIDLDLLPDLPPIPPARRAPEAEPPPSEPAWHASAVPASTPVAREKAARAPAEPTAREKAALALAELTAREKAALALAEATTPSPTEPVASAPSAPPNMTLPPRPTTLMGGEKPVTTRLKSSSESVIGPDDFFDGRYRSERGVRIQGNARGSIESRQYIFVEGGAEVEADLSAEDITVAGNFNGKIECRRKLEITSTGKVQGHVVTVLLVVQEGGQIEGELHMQRDEPAKVA